MVAGGDEKSKVDAFYVFPILEFVEIFELFEV